jgi:signal peptidase I
VIHWFLSGTVRDATAMRRHVQKLMNHQRDLLSPQAIEALETAVKDLKRATSETMDKEVLAKPMKALEEVATKWLKPYPNAAWRENIEVLLVALAVAMGIRTFFLQPFKIPTGSMQPTLYGVTSENLLDKPGAEIPKGWDRVRQWFGGTSYLNIVAKNDGELRAISQPTRFLIFNLKQTLWIGGQSYTLWFPPDYGNYPLGMRANLRIGQPFRKGDTVVKLRISAGDHLFVDRMTYNFRPPKRGEIVVFKTLGIPEDMRNAFSVPGDQFYIKRLVGLGGETVQIGEDRHLRINGKRLEASLPHFERVYSFPPGQPAQDSVYSGHVNYPHLAPFFKDHPEGVTVPKSDFMVMGDNTMNSLDSRSWGTFPASYVIGKSFFVYWPITERFGWGYHR